MKKLIVAALITVLSACVLACAVSSQLLVKGCLWWECAPQRAWRVQALDIPDRLFPSGAIINSLSRRSEGEGTIDNGEKSVYWSQGWGIAVYHVLRYPSEKAAAPVYAREENHIDTLTNLPWARPAELTFMSATADEYYVACGHWGEYRCAMVARYQEYVLQFNAVIDSSMTHSDFEKILIFLDQQISDRLYPPE